MIDTAKKLKAAFMALLADYRGDIHYYVDDERTFCQIACPLYDRREWRCSLNLLDFFDDDGDDGDDGDKCDEAILNWYMEHAND